MPHFRPPDPPACGTVVGHQFPTPSHGLPYALFVFCNKLQKRKIYFWSRISPTTFFINYYNEIFILNFIIKRFSILANRSVTPLHFVSTKSSSHTKRHIAL